MKIGDLYKYKGIDGEDESFGPWKKGGQCEGKVVEVQTINEFGPYPIEIRLLLQEEVDWPSFWGEAEKRFAVRREEITPLVQKTLADWM